ncbi:MAG: flagellar biosynthesis protein FlgJ [Opitutae bacterium]|nr:flagellar biosynthesis protein FlgJ [Opitutae bacterium]
MNVAAISAHAKPAATPALMTQPGRMAGLPQGEQVKAVAAQFEAIMLRQFLQDSVGGIMGGDKSGPGGSVYGYMLTDVLANQLSAAGGLGLSHILQQQLTPRGSAHAPAASAAQKDPS